MTQETPQPVSDMAITFAHYVLDLYKSVQAYGEHDPSCEFWVFSNKGAVSCSCGFSEALASAELALTKVKELTGYEET